jgi:hypothetical protein
MLLYDLEGETRIGQEAELMHRLGTIKKGEYGAFILSHAKDSASVDDGPCMYVHTAGALGYVHFFKGGEERHPGFQPSAHAPITSEREVRFLQVDGTEADAITVPAEIAISAERARQAALEFFRVPELPASITWFEL